MSAVFFEELLPGLPYQNLGVGSGTHAAQTGEILKRLDPVLEELSPDLVLVYGDTNSTLAAALVSSKMGILLAHVEAGLRSFRRSMPEEINRVVADHLSSLLFCPSDLAIQNLAAEGIMHGVHLVGDVMYDVMLREQNMGDLVSVRQAGLDESHFALATIHRAENTDDPNRLAAIIAGLAKIASSGLPVLVSMHPRTSKVLTGQRLPIGVHRCEPMPYRETVATTAAAKVLLTDSGGLQKEALWAGTLCVTLRDETEWPETVESGWNALAGAVPDVIADLALRSPPDGRPEPYGPPGAARRVVDVILDFTRAG